MIENDDELATTTAREVALDCIAAGIDAAGPDAAVRSAVSLDAGVLTVGDAEYDLDAFDEVHVLGGGKAAARMTLALRECLGEDLDGGVVVTDDPVDVEGIDVRRAGHPVPDDRGIRGARAVLERARSLGPSDLALVVLSGGGSALLPAPGAGIGLDDLRTVTRSLLSAGAPIEAVNAVRRHCSRIKGGRLARELAPATVHAVALSDVVGDDPSVIASGPTVGDPTTYADAVDVLERHGVEVPDPVGDHLAAGVRGARPETPPPGDEAVEAATYDVLAGNHTALAGAIRAAEATGYETLILSDRIRGDAAEVGRFHAAIAASILADGDPVSPPAVVASGGEATVRVTAEGEGGPNATAALAGGIELASATDLSRGVGENVVLAAVDTDGRDGPSDREPLPAGAIVDGRTVDDVSEARTALANDDAHGYFRERGGLVSTGRTGTNVNDLRLVVVSR